MRVTMVISIIAFDISQHIKFPLHKKQYKMRPGILRAGFRSLLKQNDNKKARQNDTKMREDMQQRVGGKTSDHEIIIVISTNSERRREEEKRIRKRRRQAKAAHRN